MAAVALLGLLAVKKAGGASPSPTGGDSSSQGRGEGPPVVSQTDLDRQKTVNQVTARAAAVGASFAANPMLGAIHGAAEIAQVQGHLYTSLLGGEHGHILGWGGVHSVPAAGGAMVGRELDKLLGGDGSGARGLVAQAAWGSTGVALVCCTGLGAVGVAIWSVIAQTVGIYVDDEVKRQQTANGDRIREWEKQYFELLQKTRQQLALNDPSATPAQIDRFAVPFCDGFMMQTDRLGYLKSMELAWGVGTQRHYHAWHQKTRGFFIGDVDTAGNYDPSNLPRRAREPGHVNSVVPWEEQDPATGKKRNPRVEYQTWMWTDPAHKTARDNLVLHASTLHDYRAARLMENREPFRKLVWSAHDVMDPHFYRMGRLLANATAYVTWMQEPWGLGASENSHGFYGRNDGLFEGTLLSGPFRWKSARGGRDLVLVSGTAGRLEWDGIQFYWRAEDGEKGVYAMLEDVTP